MNVEEEVNKPPRCVLNLDLRAAPLTGENPLLGSVLELGPMAVVSILAALEERFGFAIDDDEIDGRTFVSVVSFMSLVQTS